MFNVCNAVHIFYIIIDLYGCCFCGHPVSKSCIFFLYRTFMYLPHCCFSDDGTSIGRQRSSEGHHVTFCDSLVESSQEGNNSSVITNDAPTNRNNSSAVKETLEAVRQCDSPPVSPAGDATPKAPILRVHRTPR